MSNTPVRAYLSLGSNLGDRRALLREAVRLLRAVPQVEVTRVSSLYETPPVGGPAEQGPYLNAAIAIRTTRQPDAVLGHAQAIEARLGRQRTVRDGPRTIDIDLLLHGRLIVNRPGLRIPHPRMSLRRFVLVPLAEIAPDAVHPILGKTSIELLEALSGLEDGEVQRVVVFDGPGWAG